MIKDKNHYNLKKKKRTEGKANINHQLILFSSQQSWCSAETHSSKKCYDVSLSWEVCVICYSLHSTFLLPRLDLDYSMWSFPLTLIINGPTGEIEREQRRLEHVFFSLFHVKSSCDVRVMNKRWFYVVLLFKAYSQTETSSEGWGKLMENKS